MNDDCVFCKIVAGREPATVVHRWAGVLAIVPLNPVTDGHIIVLPLAHIRDAAQVPFATAEVMFHAAELAAAETSCNIITSIGAEATQSVFHLHVHIVPRRWDDGLKLPWTD